MFALNASMSPSCWAAEALQPEPVPPEPSVLGSLGGNAAQRLCSPPRLDCSPNDKVQLLTNLSKMNSGIYTIKNMLLFCAKLWLLKKIN